MLPTASSRVFAASFAGGMSALLAGTRAIRRNVQRDVEVFAGKIVCVPKHIDSFNFHMYLNTYETETEIRRRCTPGVYLFDNLIYSLISFIFVYFPYFYTCLDVRISYTSF